MDVQFPIELWMGVAYTSTQCFEIYRMKILDG